MRALVVLLVAVVAIVAAQTTGTPAPTTTGSTPAPTTTAATTAAATTGTPVAPSGNGPSYIAIITTDGCPDWRGLLSTAAAGAGLSASELQLYAYLGCLIRESSHSGQLQFYVTNDPKGDKAKAAANALKGKEGVLKTSVQAAPNNIPAPPPKKKKGKLSKGAIAGICVGIVAFFVIIVIVKIMLSPSSNNSGGDNPNYAKM